MPHSALSRTETQNFFLHFWVLLVLVRCEIGIKNVFERFKAVRLALQVTWVNPHFHQIWVFYLVNFDISAYNAKPRMFGDVPLVF